MKSPKIVKNKTIKDTQNALSEKLKMGCFLKATSAITNKITSNIRGINIKPKYRSPPNKIKEEVTKEIANAFNANMDDRSAEAYNPRASRIEQTSKGNKNPEVNSKSRPH